MPKPPSTGMTAPVTYPASGPARNATAPATSSAEAYRPSGTAPRMAFFRSSVSRQRAIGGTGLGLAICRAIVEGYGGHVDVDSTYGVGTTVMVVLPAVRLDDLSTMDQNSGA